MNTPKITISVTCDLNLEERRKSLIRCFESIAKSTMKDFEVILTSNIVTRKEKEWFEKKFPFITYLWLPDATPVLRLTAGIANAKAPYILQLDDDTYIYPETLGDIIKVFDKKPARVGALALEVYDTNQDRYYYKNNPKFADFKKDDFPLFIGGAVVFRRSIFEKTGFYDPDFFLTTHENDLAIRIFDQGYDIHYVPEIAVNHAHINNNRNVYFAIFYALRNHVWIDLKFFSWKYVPFLILFHFIQAVFGAVTRRSLKVFAVYMQGIGDGLIRANVALKQRKVVSQRAQTMYLRMVLIDFYRYKGVYTFLKWLIGAK